MADVFDAIKIFYYVLKINSLAPFPIKETASNRKYLLRKKDIIITFIHFNILIIFVIIVIRYSKTS